MAGGQGFTSAQGSVTQALTVALVGAAITASAGSLSPNNADTVPLVGAEVSTQQETISPSWSQTLTGVEVTSSAGTLTINLRPTNITGQVVTLSAGTVSAEGTGATAHLSGVELTADVGTLTGGVQDISGTAVTVSAGTIPPALELPLTGVEIASTTGTTSPAQSADDTFVTVSAGTATPSVDVALTGSEATFAQGTLTVTGDAFVELVGEAITSAAGTLIYDKQEPLTGVSITSEMYFVGAPGGAELTGIEIATTAGEIFTTDDRSFALTGIPIAVQDGSCFASPLAFVEGQSLTVEAQQIGPVNVDLTGIEFPAEAGLVEAPSRRRDEAGRPKKKKHQVEINGEVYDADSEAEALYMLEKVKEEAEKTAALALERATKALKKPVRKILQDARKALKPPVVEVEELPSEAEQILKEIDELYKDTLMKVEIAALLRKQEEDEEEAILLMLV
jgi:hypothetical protein